MKTLKVNLKPHYKIYIGKNISLNLKNILSKLNLGNYGIVITNKTVFSLYKKLIKKVFKDKKIRFTFKILPDSEKIKSLYYISKILNELGELSFKKRAFFICWGGGVIGDFGGFVASIYKRGSPYIQIPTTLLSQIDSSIGGKTAVDLKTAKNLVGSFWQPRLVVSDISFLKTLTSSQLREGLFEAIKYGLIRARWLFCFIEENYKKLLEKRENLLFKLVFSCAKIKKEIIEKDEREQKGLRTILNFGHTIGHGLEAASNYRISHGKAVGLGVLSSLYISEKEGLLKDKKIIERTRKLLKEIKLPLRVKIDKSKLISAIQKDKKFIKGKTRMVLLEDIGKPKIKENIKISTILKEMSNIITLC